MKFCTNCGAALGLKEIEHRQRAWCPECGTVHYEQLKVGAGALIERDNKLLLLQRTHAPWTHCWNLPAGYVEVDESPGQAVIREVYEETGLHVQVADLVDVYFYDDDPRGNGILVVYRCSVLSGALTESEEAALPTFFAPEEIRPNLAGGGNNQAIRSWQELHA